jgi:hypothetical protein
MDNDLATRLAPLAVLNGRGEAVPLGPFWAQQPAVLGFVRHFG